MKFPIFASLIVFILWLGYEISKAGKKNEEAENAFWEKENQANSVRKKSLEHLPYVHFPFDRLPTEESFLNAGRPIPESLEILKSLQDKQMVNLNGISNTDLKLTYGTANITILSEYDANYEIFSKNIYELAKQLDDAGRTGEALFLLEETLVYGTDISGHYKLLARIYQRNEQMDNILMLREKASQLTSLTREPILAFLDDIISQM